MHKPSSVWNNSKLQSSDAKLRADDVGFKGPFALPVFRQKNSHVLFVTFNSQHAPTAFALPHICVPKYLEGPCLEEVSSQFFPHGSKSNQDRRCRGGANSYVIQRIYSFHSPSWLSSFCLEGRSWLPGAIYRKLCSSGSASRLGCSSASSCYATCFSTVTGPGARQTQRNKAMILRLLRAVDARVMLHQSRRLEAEWCAPTVMVDATSRIGCLNGLVSEDTAT